MPRRYHNRIVHPNEIGQAENGGALTVEIALGTTYSSLLVILGGELFQPPWLEGAPIVE